MNIKIINNYSNAEVTNHYLNVIKDGINKSHIATAECINSLSSINKGDFVLVSTTLDVVKLYLKGHRNIMLWMQGIVPEESYMKHKSKLRWRILSIIDKFALKKSRFTFFVSNEMKLFIECKYRISIKDYYIMPCYNDNLNIQSLNKKGKFSNNYFTYVGSLFPWQCFEETLALFKYIENRIPKTKLFIFTKEIRDAENLVNKYKIENYSIECVPSSQINERLAYIKYGFVIREDNSVNNVATPTKLSNYMSAGVIPITTTAIKDFVSRTKNFKSVCILKTPEDVQTLERFISQNIERDTIKSEFTSIFEDYYCDSFHIDNIAKTFRVLSKGEK